MNFISTMNWVDWALVYGVVITILFGAWIFVRLWNTRGLDGYRASVKYWLDDQPEDFVYDDMIAIDYFLRGESSWNAAQAMAVKS